MDACFSRGFWTARKSVQLLFPLLGVLRLFTTVRGFPVYVGENVNNAHVATHFHDLRANGIGSKKSVFHSNTGFTAQYMLK